MQVVAASLVIARALDSSSHITSPTSKQKTWKLPQQLAPSRTSIARTSPVSEERPFTHRSRHSARTVGVLMAHYLVVQASERDQHGEPLDARVHEADQGKVLVAHHEHLPEPDRLGRQLREDGRPLGGG